MSGLFGFRCSTDDAPLAASTLVIFCGPTALAETDLQAIVQRETRTGAAPEQVYLIVPDGQVVTALSIDRRHMAWDPLSDRGTAIDVLGYGASGSLRRHDKLGSASAVAEKLSTSLRRQGLTHMFRMRAAMLEAGPTAHFVKPSGKPARRFLRAAQALSEGPEIYFAALWLLPWLQKDVSVVHVDTSSISHLVFAAQLLKGRAYDGELAQVRTFRSYEGIGAHSFSRDRREVCLVSASESGTMAAALAGKVRERRDVLTIFSTADAPDGTAVLCDLRFDETLNPLGFSVPESEDAPSLRASRSIRLLGEHFVAEAMPASAVTPMKADAPGSVAHLAKIKGGAVFSMLKSNPADDGKAPWVGVEALLRTAHGEQWLREKACAAIPVTTKALVLADDHQDTRAFADALGAEVERQTDRKPDWAILDHKSIEGGCGIWTKHNPTAPVLVISGATGHGRELLSVSRALRDYAPKSVRIFLTTVVSAASAEAVDMLRRNLEFGGHRFVRLFDLPIDRRRSTGSWRLEAEYLQIFDDELPDLLRDRLVALGETSAGLRNNLFLARDAEPLALRQNFAFWDRGDATDADQADVFVTIAAILEHLRTGVGPNAPRKLLNDANTQTVLSPEVFSRFNDGVIQSALLRAALPVELNYASSRDQSRAIADLILQMCDLYDRPQGEALIEFLMALRSSRLQLEEFQLKRLEEGLATKADSLPEVCAWLINNPRPTTLTTEVR